MITFDGKCFNCGADSGFNWFCPECVEVKQKAYAESAALGENWAEVMIRRDRALEDYRRVKNGQIS